MSKPNFAKDQLKSIVERIERLEEEKAAIGGDIKEVYAEAKGQGFDTKIIRQVVRLRKLTPEERQERDALVDLYMNALGMLADTPLGKASRRGAMGRLGKMIRDGEVTITVSK